ncbi:MAG: AI-2E family transporter [Chryseobacterium sp.]|nr:MAG: AI-2E family transporter [Chryseobacterium sp.]
MNKPLSDNTYQKAVKLIVVAALVVAGFYFAYQIVGVLFMLFFAVVLTLVLNAPTMWLVKKKVPRTLAAIIVFFVTMVFLGFVGWLVIPRILD